MPEVKLQCIAPAKLGKVINHVQIKRHLKKYQAMHYLLDLAVAHPTFEPVVNFGDDRADNCTLILTEEEFVQTEAYRIEHSLVNNTRFFLDALSRGASYYLETVQPGERSGGAAPGSREPAAAAKPSRKK